MWRLSASTSASVGSGPGGIFASGRGQRPASTSAWVGSTVLLGAVPALARKPTDRCVFTTRALPGIERDLQIYRSLKANNNSNLGIYLVAQAAGAIAVGDSAGDTVETEQS